MVMDQTKAILVLTAVIMLLGTLTLLGFMSLGNISDLDSKPFKFWGWYTNPQKVKIPVRIHSEKPESIHSIWLEAKPNIIANDLTKEQQYNKLIALYKCNDYNYTDCSVLNKMGYLVW